MKIAVTSLHDHNYQVMADITWNQNKKLYCEKWGYEAFLKTSGFDPAIPIGFEKIVLIKRVMELGRHDWIYWAGCDTLITNFLIPLTNFCYSESHFVIATDFNNLNADSFLVRNSMEGRAYIDMILRKLPEYRNNNLYEQGVMIDTYKEYQHLIKIVPQAFLNSYQYNLYCPAKGARNSNDCMGFSGDWQPGHFLLHCPDQQLQLRINLFKEYLLRVIK